MCDRFAVRAGGKTVGSDIELGVISWIRYRFMDTPLTSAVFQVMIGGLLVFLTGILIGSS